MNNSRFQIYPKLQKSTKAFLAYLLKIGMAFALLSTSDLIASQNTQQPVQSLKTSAVSVKTGVASLGSLQQTENYFNQVITHIDTTLLEKHQEFKKDNNQLAQFVDTNILSVWDVELTLKQMIGGKHWKSFSQGEIQSLKDRFNQTLHRYVREGMGYYDSQRVKLVSVKLNKKNTRGLVTIRLEPIYMPAFNISFKIANKNQDWQLYDVLVKGISYVKMKKSEYRQIISQKGVDGLLAYLDQKNGKNRSGESEGK